MNHKTSPIFEQVDPFQMICYDGKDNHLKEKPYCFGCRFQHNDPNIVKASKPCTRCNVAWYCSRQCQKKNYKDHRDVCDQIETGMHCLELTAEPLRNYFVRTEEEEEDNFVAENLFETRAGEFHRFDTQEYLENRRRLAKSYWKAAYDSDVKVVWEKSLFHYLEILRLDAKHCGEARFRVPFLLLSLNRDDDAFAFICYWLQFDDQDDYSKVLARHHSSREGDWLYPIERNCRFLDIFQECPNLDDQKVAGAYFVALAIIKMRIVAFQDAMMRELDYVFQQTDGKRIQEVRSLVEDMIIGCDIDNQRQQLKRILERIQPAMLNVIEELMSESEMGQFYEIENLTRHYPFPINIVLNSGARSFSRIPGAFQMLERYSEVDERLEFLATTLSSGRTLATTNRKT